MKKKIILFFITLIIIVAAFLSYSRYISTSGILVKEYKVSNNKVSSNFHGMKIIHLSDIHFGRTVDKVKLEAIRDKVNRLNPDIIVLTGDLFDKDNILSSEDQAIVTDVLNGMNAKLGKYAIMGNHDFKHDYFTAIISNAGFTNLNNKFELVYNLSSTPIIIAGLNSNIKDDTLISKKLEGLTKELEANVALKDVYKILLMHEPDYIDNMNYSTFDLVLAGHTHGGQVRFPLVGAVVLPPGGKKYYDEYYKLDNTDLYVSSGLGTSNINFRFLNRPSFNFYRITKG